MILNKWHLVIKNVIRLLNINIKMEKDRFHRFDSTPNLIPSFLSSLFSIHDF